MKFITFFIAILLCITTSFVSTQSNNSYNCQTIVDSANALIHTSEKAINTKPTINNRQRSFRIDNWLQKLSFKEFRCLLDNESISIKAIGFMYAASFHGDSLLKNYQYLLTDTTTVQFFYASGNTGPKFKLGELLSMVVQKIKEDKDNHERRPEIEGTVSAFIKKYSTYPDSYRPHLFPCFSIGSGDQGINYFKVTHDYEIINNEGKNVRVVNAFVFDKNLRLNLIEKDSCFDISIYPPKLNYWLKEFGRQLSKSDSLTLGLW
jgi:hypothetical protein